MDVLIIISMIEFPMEVGIAKVRNDYPSKDASLVAAVEEGNIHEIAADLSPQVKNQLVQLLANNLDVFSWKPADMIGVPRELAEPNLGLNQYTTPILQKRRSLSLEWSQPIDAQVTNLIKVGILRLIEYETWVANPMLIKKHNGTWRMCVDFTSLNKACLKDNYRLPLID
ncbi:hypothetical protein Tco_0148895 [Tanacetum coccineum]